MELKELQAVAFAAAHLLLVLGICIALACEAIRKLLHKRKATTFTYGTAGPHQTHARRNLLGTVEFVLWKAGEQGHQEDWWVAMDSYWWPTFEPYDTPTTEKPAKRGLRTFWRSPS